MEKPRKLGVLARAPWQTRKGRRQVIWLIVGSWGETELGLMLAQFLAAGWP